LEICKTDEDERDDTPGDNFSFSDSNGNRFYFITPDVLIYRRGNYEVYENSNYGEKRMHSQI
jgi:hypothetical protein